MVTNKPTYEGGTILKPKRGFDTTDFPLPHMLVLEGISANNKTFAWTCLELETGRIETYTESSLDWYWELKD